MRILAALVALTATVAAFAVGFTGAATAGKDRRGHDHGHDRGPASLQLPNGWRPEGIAAGRHRLYVGSIPTGSVLALDPRTGDSRVVVPAQTGRAAIGLKLARGKLFVAGGPTGKGFVYDARSGADVAQFQLAPAGTTDTFVNDVIVTRKGAFFTDSRRQVLYVVAPDLSGARELALPDIALQEGNNLNGIAYSRRAGALIAVQTNAGVLWKIDPDTGRAVQIDLGGASVANGDGLLLEGRTLYVVQNRDNRIAVVRLSDDLTSGTIVKTITSPLFDVPTTVARLGRSLYLPNARFSTPPTPDTTYSVTRVKARGAHGHK